MYNPSDRKAKKSRVIQRWVFWSFLTSSLALGQVAAVCCIETPGGNGVISNDTGSHCENLNGTTMGHYDCVAELACAPRIKDLT